MNFTWMMLCIVAFSTKGMDDDIEDDEKPHFYSLSNYSSGGPQESPRKMEDVERKMMTLAELFPSPYEQRCHEYMDIIQTPKAKLETLVLFIWEQFGAFWNTEIRDTNPFEHVQCLKKDSFCSGILEMGDYIQGAYNIALEMLTIAVCECQLQFQHFQTKKHCTRIFLSALHEAATKAECVLLGRSNEIRALQNILNKIMEDHGVDNSIRSGMKENALQNKWAWKNSYGPNLHRDAVYKKLVSDLKWRPNKHKFSPSNLY